MIIFFVQSIMVKIVRSIRLRTDPSRIFTIMANVPMNTMVKALFAAKINMFELAIHAFHQSSDRIGEKKFTSSNGAGPYTITLRRAKT